MEEKKSENVGYQVLITNIKWNKDTIGQYRVKHDNYDDLPTQFTLDIPDNIIKTNTSNTKDLIETFVFNFLTKKYGHEVNNCSIWLLLKDELVA